MDDSDVYRNRDTSLRGGESGTYLNVVFAFTFLDRVRGLFRYKNLDGVIVIAPCHDIHTWGMKKPIDVAFISDDGRVLKTEQNLMPFKRARCRKAVCVIERYTCEQEWLREGEKVGLVCL